VPGKQYREFRVNTSLLTQKEFNTHVAQRTLRLSFVGMSNSGKTRRSRTLKQECDFRWYQVDADIQKDLGFTGQDDISKWLGFPTDSGYAEREKTYLELEARFTKQASMQSHGANLVFDTTGSVVHLPHNVLEVLEKNTLIVHLDVGNDSLRTLLKRFFENPKPLVWDTFFIHDKTKSRDELIRESYPRLLEERLKRYRELAHVNVEASLLWDLDAQTILSRIREQLP